MGEARLELALFLMSLIYSQLPSPLGTLTRIRWSVPTVNRLSDLPEESTLVLLRRVELLIQVASGLKPDVYANSTTVAYGGRGGIRTHTVHHQGSLSPSRLPVPSHARLYLLTIYFNSIE